MPEFTTSTKRIDGGFDAPVTAFVYDDASIWRGSPVKPEGGGRWLDQP